jgi:hypothetical protein
VTYIDFVNLAVLALVIGVSTFAAGCRKLRQAQEAAADARQELEDCEQARRELQEFILLFNYGATQEAYEHLTACGFETVEPARPASHG